MMVRYVKHPKDDTLINVARYADIRCCPKNPTHIDFYVNPQAEGERGNPSYTITFDTKEERDAWFESITHALAEVVFE